MAIEDEINTPPPTSADVAQSIAAELLQPGNLDKISKTITNAGAETTKLVLSMAMGVMGELAGIFAEGIIRAEDENEAVFNRVSALAVKDLLGVDVSRSGGRGAPGRGLGSNDATLGGAILKALGGSPGNIEPNDQRAKEFIGAVTNFGIEGWMSGWIFNAISSVIPFEGFGHIEGFGELDDVLAKALGFERLSRRVIGPYVNATTVTPFQWYVNKLYRTELMSASLLAREVARGRKTRDQAFEELARQGFRDDHIEALLNEARKTISVSDLLYLAREGGGDPTFVRAELKNAGYDENAINVLLLIENVKRYRPLEEKIAATAAAAYVDAHMDRSEFMSILSATYQDEHERELFLQLTELQKAAKLRRLSDGEMREAVEQGIQSNIDYRRYLRDEGYDEDAILIKELLLNKVISSKEDKQRDKERLEREKIAAAEAAKLEDLKKRDALERKQEAIGPGIGEIKRAVVRGFVSMARYETALRAMGVVAADIAFLVEQLQADRDAYLAAEALRTDAGAKAAARQLSIGDLDRAFLEGIISIGDYADRLVAAGFTDRDVRILVDLVESKKADAEAARELRDRVEVSTRAKDVSLSQAEAAVERGLWSLAQFSDYVTAAGYNAGAAATLTELLRVKLEDAAAAEKRREEIALELAQKSVSLSDVENAVVRGLRSLATYETFLKDQGYSVADQALLVDLLEDKAADAEYARSKRAEVAAALKDKPLTLAQVERGVLLGTLTIDAYRQFLEQNSYAGDTITVLVENLTRDIQQRRADEAAAVVVEAQAIARGFDYVALAAGLRDGSISEDVARAELVQLGLAGDDIELALAVLAAVRAGDVDMATRETAIAAELSARSLSLVQFQDAVEQGLRTFDDYGAFLLEQGYSLVDMLLLITLLSRRLDAKAAKAAAPAKE